MEEHPGSINDSAFATDPAGARNPPSVRLIDVPASFHSRGAHFGFADGHVELHRWLGTRVPQRVVGGGGVSLLVSAPNDPDAVWLGLRAAHLR
jgi:prepilin-type processing-associated H-X9-DG protein